MALEKSLKRSLTGRLFPLTPALTIYSSSNPEFLTQNYEIYSQNMNFSAQNPDFLLFQNTAFSSRIPKFSAIGRCFLSET